MGDGRANWAPTNAEIDAANRAKVLHWKAHDVAPFERCRSPECVTAAAVLRVAAVGTRHPPHVAAPAPSLEELADRLGAHERLSRPAVIDWIRYHARKRRSDRRRAERAEAQRDVWEAVARGEKRATRGHEVRELRRKCARLHKQVLDLAGMLKRREPKRALTSADRQRRKEQPRPGKNGARKAYKRIRGVRLAALLAKDPRCCWCGANLDSETATIEHLRPLSVGGSNDETNTALACRECNR